MDKPKILKDLKFINYTLLQNSFVYKNKPNPNLEGYVYSNTGIEDSVKFDKESKLFSMVAILTLIGYNGKSEDQEDDNKKNEVFSINIKIRLHYNYSDDKTNEEILSKYKWFFQAQASIVTIIMAKEHLATTHFNSLVDIPIIL